MRTNTRCILRVSGTCGEKNREFTLLIYQWKIYLKNFLYSTLAEKKVAERVKGKSGCMGSLSLSLTRLKNRTYRFPG